MSALGLGLGITRKKRRGATRGPEIVTQDAGTGWTTGAAGVTMDGSGIHYVSTANLAAALHSYALEDNTQYELIFTVANYVGGQVKIIIYGATTAHSGQGTNRVANGTYTELLTTSAAGSNANQIRVQATGVSGTNTFDITHISLKKVLT